MAQFTHDPCRVEPYEQLQFRAAWYRPCTRRGSKGATLRLTGALLAPFGATIIRRLLGSLLAGAILLLARVAPADAAQYAYLPDYFGGTVSVIDTATNTLKATIPVGRYPLGGVVNPVGSRVYVADAEGIKVIDTHTNTVVATVPVKAPCAGCTAFSWLVVSPNGKRVYAGGGFAVPTFVLDADSNTQLTTPPLPAGPLAMKPDGSRLFVRGGDGIKVIDTATHAVVDSLPMKARDARLAHPTPQIGASSLDAGPLTPLAFSPDGARLYAESADGVLVIEIATNTGLATLPARGPVYISPNGKRLYAREQHGDGIQVIDTTSYTPVGMLPVKGVVGIPPAGKPLYVVDTMNLTTGPSRVSVIDPTTNTVTATILLPGRSPLPQGQFIGPEVRTP